jgi:hypothetical protein
VAKFGGEAARGFEIDEIIVGKLLALKLLGGGEAFWRAAGGDVERRSLVRVFAVAKFLLATKSQVQALGQNWFWAERHVIGGSGKPLEFGGDHAVVAGGGGENFASEL